MVYPGCFQRQLLYFEDEVLSNLQYSQTMVADMEQLLKPDYFANAQYSARELPVPKFPNRSTEVKSSSLVKNVRCIAWSCDGRRVATGTELKGIRIWEASKDRIETSTSFPLPSGGEKTTPHTGHVGAIAWSPVEPNILISGCKASAGGATIAVWDTNKPKTAVATFRIPNDILHLAFHPSGNHFAVVCPKSRDEAYFYWRVLKDGVGPETVWERRDDVGLGGPLIDIGSEEINSLRFNNSGKLVCAVSNDGSLNAWLYPTERRPNEVINEPEIGKMDTDEVKSEALQSSMTAAEVDGADGKSRATSTREATPEEKEGGREGDGEGAEPAQPTEVEGAETEGAGLDPEIAESGVQPDYPEAATKLQEEAEEEVEMIEAADGGEAVPAASAPDTAAGEEAASRDIEMGGTAETAETANGQPEGDVEMAEVGAEKQDASTQAPISAAPSRPISRATSPSAKDRRAAASPRPPPIAAPGDVVTPSAPAAEGRRAQQEAEARKRQLKRFRQAICHSASLLSLSFCPTGRYLAVGGQDALLSVMDTRNWICVRTFDVCVAAIRHTAFSPDGELIAMGGDDPFIAIVSVFSGQTIAKIPITGNLVALCWHPRQNWLAYSTSSKQVIMWHHIQQEA